MTTGREPWTTKTLRDPGGGVSAMTAPLHKLLRQAEAIQARQISLTDKQRNLETSVRRARGQVIDLRRTSRAASQSVSCLAHALRAASWRLNTTRTRLRHRRARLEPLLRNVSWARTQFCVVVDRLPSVAGAKYKGFHLLEKGKGTFTVRRVPHSKKVLGTEDPNASSAATHCGPTSTPSKNASALGGTSNATNLLKQQTAENLINDRICQEVLNVGSSVQRSISSTNQNNVRCSSVSDPDINPVIKKYAIITPTLPESLRKRIPLLEQCEKENYKSMTLQNSLQKEFLMIKEKSISFKGDKGSKEFVSKGRREIPTLGFHPRPTDIRAMDRSMQKTKPMTQSSQEEKHKSLPPDFKLHIDEDL
uniref:uncharacterized protein n=1 Tax=Myxine glutinosa TaxID=7769 RepID=UPI00358E9D23